MQEQQHPQGQQSAHKRLTKSVKRSQQTFCDPWPHFGEAKTAGIWIRLNLTFRVTEFFFKVVVMKDHVVSGRDNKVTQRTGFMDL